MCLFDLVAIFFFGVTKKRGQKSKFRRCARDTQTTLRPRLRPGPGPGLDPRCLDTASADNGRSLRAHRMLAQEQIGQAKQLLKGAKSRIQSASADGAGTDGNSLSGVTVLHLCETIFHVRFLCFAATQQLGLSETSLLIAVQAGSQTSRQQQAVDQIQRAISNTAEQATILQGELFSHLKLEAEGGACSPSRLVAVTQQYELSMVESLMLALLVLEGTGFTCPDTLNNLTTLERFRIASGASAGEVLEFLAASRKHVVEGLIEVTEDEFGGDFSKTLVKLPREVLSALWENPVRSEDRLKLDGTTLGNIIVSDNSRRGEVKEAEDVASTPSTDTGDATPIELMDQDAVLAMLMAEAEEELKKEGQEDAQDIELDSDGDDAPGSNAEALDRPYEDDLEYLEDGFALVTIRIRKFFLSLDDDKDSYQMSLRQKRPEAIARELDAKERKALARWSRRTSLTLAGKWQPRLERLGARLGLNDLEKLIILTLVGGIISQDVRKAVASGSNGMSSNRGFEVGHLLAVHCLSLRDQIGARSVFYRNAPLIHGGLIKLSERRYGIGDLSDCVVQVDRRMMDFLLGLNTEIGELVEGSTCFTPSVTLDQVVLPKATKGLLLQTIRDFDDVVRLRKLVGFDEVVRNGKGLIILFHGPPGTGKTMTANALANYMQKKMLNVNHTIFSGDADPDVYSLLFREARLQNALIFIDECEPLFESRDNLRQTRAVNVALTAIESFDGILLLATNRPHSLDQAMHRRISLAIEFPMPPPELRLNIWMKHVPSSLPISQDIDWSVIANQYEFSGGFIKNAMLQALTFAVARRRIRSPTTLIGVGADSRLGSDIVADTGAQKVCDLLTGVEVTQADIVQACQLQVRSHLTSYESDVTENMSAHNAPPTFASLVLPDDVISSLEGIVAFEKSRSILYLQWGFNESEHFSQSVSKIVVFAGPRGTGKTFAALATASEAGKPVKVLSFPELLRMRAVGLRSSENIAGIFRDARNSGAILLMKSTGTLLSGSIFKTNASVAASAILFHLKRYPGTVILCAATMNPAVSRMRVDESVWNPMMDPMPSTVAAMVSEVVEFPFPQVAARAKLWRTLIPKGVPLGDAVDFDELAGEFELSGAEIRACILKVASSVSVRSNADRIVKMHDIQVVARDFQRLASKHNRGGVNMYL